MTSCNNEPAYENIKVTERQPCVYITNTGDHYHSSGCHYLSRSKIAIGKQQAINAGYICCSVCGGKSSETINVSYTKKVQIDPSHKNIILSIFLSIMLAIMPAMLIGVKIFDRLDTDYSSTTPVANTPKPILSNSSNKEDRQENSTDREKLIQKLKQRPQSNLNNVIGREVIHNKFGIGKIIEISKDYISVMFKDPYGKKMFQFPQSLIDGFLKFK